ncbi:MAG: CotH kinase family protein [Treponema sp.]|jgi:hypothetical protein|nr:CotH kinase family protein [Treponema sp.]
MRKIIFLFLIALCCLFVTCKEPNNNSYNNDDDDNDYKNPNSGTSRELKFSHDSGLYSGQFKLTLTAPEDSAIYYSTDGSVPSPGKAGTVKYSSPITVQNRNGQANVLATTANNIQFYMALDDPRGSVPQVYQPTKDQVPKATVIRAIEVNSSGKAGAVATKTYFIGNNLSDYGNIRVLSLVSDPYNLVDENYGIMVRGKSSYRWDSTPPYNFRMKGTDWERPAYLEIFEGNSRDKASLSTGVGIRVRGGWSRAAGQKSFNVYFKEQYGINNLKNYNLIPKDAALGTTGAVKADGTPVATYKSFMLRNGANDIDYTKFYDVFIQDLLSDRSFSTQASVPCVVYLNGEYWGPYNFQERYSDNHTEYKYGVDRNNVISFDNYELDDGNPGEESYFWNMMNMAKNDMSNPANYDAFCAVFDIDNFIDYWASEIYVFNEDWPHNNFRLWRTRNTEAGNPYGDTKWRYQMFDTEFALGIYKDGGIGDAIDKILNGSEKDNQINKLFKSLLANQNFCRKFVNTMMDIYNVNFHPDNYLPKLNSYEAVYRPLMEGYFSRWGRPWDTVYQNKANDAKKYLKDIRNAMVNNYLPTHFSGIGVSGGSLRDVTVSATGISGAAIKINTITPNLGAGSWTGKYYSGNPITVTASAPPNGYEFDGWTITNGAAASPSALTTTVTITGNAQITSRYRQTGNAVVPVTGISLNKTSLNLKIGETAIITAAISPVNATYKTVIWVSGNSDVASVNNGTVTAVNGGTTVITASTVEGKNSTCTVTVREPTVLLDLAEILKTQSNGNINWSAFKGLISGNDKVEYKIITENSVKKLQFIEYYGSCPGLDLRNDKINFKVGDIIEIKGTFTQISNKSSGVVLNLNNWGWEPLEGWGYWSQGEFEKTYGPLTQNNVNSIKVNPGTPGIRIRSCLIEGENWDQPFPGGIGKVVIEQIKISRIE